MPSVPRAPKLTIAIVDDHAGFRTAAVQILETAGYAVEGFSSVAAFVASGALLRIHCLMLDVGMPEIDGLALQECLRCTNYELPIVFCSGHPEAKARAIANGAAAFLPKPVTASRLLKTIRTACAQPRRKQ